MAKKPVETREPVAVFEIPAGLRSSELGLSENRTINAWALDRALCFLGVSRLDIRDAIAETTDGRYVELVREGDTLALYDKL